VVLLDKSFGHEFTERLLQAIAERTSEVRSRQSDRTREIAETALWGASHCSQQLKLQIIQLRLHPGQSVASAHECPVSVTCSSTLYQLGTCSAAHRSHGGPSRALMAGNEDAPA
jgi:hypothetical protein